MLYKNKKIDFYAIRVSASLFYSYSCFLFDVLGFQPPWDKIMIHTLHCCLLVVRTTRLRLMIILSSKDFDTQTFFLKNVWYIWRLHKISVQANICILLVQKDNKNLIICFDCAYSFILIILIVVSPMLKIIHVIVRWAISWIWIFNQGSVSAEYASILRFVRERTKEITLNILRFT